MNKKTAVVVALVTILVVSVGGPAFANQCPTLIKQANDKIATMDQNSDTVKKAKELVAEADRLHKAGTHSESVAKAQEALAALK
jgi:predicted O-methyltransferase YrrM